MKAEVSIYYIDYVPGVSVTPDGALVENQYIAQAATKMLIEDGPRDTLEALLAFPNFRIRKLTGG